MKACPTCDTSMINIKGGMFRCRNPQCKQITPTPVERPSNKQGLFTSRKKPEDIFHTIPTISQLDELIMTLPSLRDQILLRLLYCTGCRVEELLSLTPFQFNSYTDGNNDQYLVINSVRVSKKKKPTFRNVELIRDKYSLAIFDYIKLQPNRMEPIFQISRQTAWQICKKIRWENYHLFPHLLRAIRVSHLAEAGMDQKELMNEWKWSNGPMPLHYIFVDKEKTKAKKKLATLQ